MALNKNKKSLLGLIILSVLLLFGLSKLSFAQQAQESTISNSDTTGIMTSFTEKEEALGDAVAISDKRKHQVLFIMGIFLLIFIFTTAILGLRMVLFGKEVFVAHMIFAGGSVFLATAHAVTAIVWFFPF